jgi:hypothetical protein
LSWRKPGTREQQAGGRPGATTPTPSPARPAPMHTHARPLRQAAPTPVPPPPRAATPNARNNSTGVVLQRFTQPSSSRPTAPPARPLRQPTHVPPTKPKTSTSSAAPPHAQGAGKTATSRNIAAAASRQPPQRNAVQPLRARVVQATKVYPNLHPGAVERVEPGNVFRLESFTDQYRLRKKDSHGVYVPNQQYNFVRTVEGQMLLHNRYRHPSIAEGRQVLYAGEVFFNNGKLEWWSNGSGHYQPDSEDAAQAALPLNNFYTYQQIIKGEHKQRQFGQGRAARSNARG